MRRSSAGIDGPGLPELYSALIESMRLGLYIYRLDDPADDRSLRMVAANPAAEEATGVAAENLVGKGIDDCFPGLRERGVPEAFAQVVRTGEATRLYDFEYGDNRVPQRIWAFTAVALEDRHVAVLFEDATGVRRALEAGDDSRMHFRGLFEHTHDAVFIYDLEGRVLVANQVAADLAGYARDEMVGKSYLDYAAESEREEAAAVLETLLGGDAVPPYERTIRRPDGSEITVEISAALIHDASGKPHHIQSLVRDVTERREAEAALRESEERFRTLVQNAPEAIVLFDTDRKRFVEANENALQLYKIDRSILVQLGPIELSPPTQPDGRPSAAAAEAYIRQAVEGEVPVFEWVHQDTEGRQIPCEVRLVRLSAAHPNLIRGSVTDISERKQVERERRELEARVQHAQKLESLGILAGGVAHDFNNLLLAILGNAELAGEILDRGHPARERLQAIEEATLRASDLTNQMLAYAGRSHAELVTLDLTELVRGLGRLLETVVPKKTDLRYELAEDLPSILADRAQIQQVVMNLLTNAADALGEEGGRVEMRTGTVAADAAQLSNAYFASELEGETFVCLEVADEGCGMETGLKERIFEPFFSTKFAGRGLGLAAVLGIVRSHRGALQVDSSPGQGTVFTVFFPTAAEHPAGRGGTHPVPEDWQGTGLVLLVDDEATVRGVLARQLEMLGFEVVEAADGREAVQLFRQHRERLAAVVLDRTMPVMGGEEAARAMHQAAPGVPVILLSGYAADELAGRDALEGVVGFLQKPFTWAELRRVLHDATS